MTDVELKGMQILLPPAADVTQEELDAWTSGQAYLILNYGTEDEFEAAARTSNLILEQAEKIATLSAIDPVALVQAGIDAAAVCVESNPRGMFNYEDDHATAIRALSASDVLKERK